MKGRQFVRSPSRILLTSKLIWNSVPQSTPTKILLLFFIVIIFVLFIYFVVVSFWYCHRFLRQLHVSTVTSFLLWCRLFVLFVLFDCVCVIKKIIRRAPNIAQVSAHFIVVYLRLYVYISQLFPSIEFHNG